MNQLLTLFVVVSSKNSANLFHYLIYLISTGNYTDNWYENEVEWNEWTQSKVHGKKII